MPPVSRKRRISQSGRRTRPLKRLRPGLSRRSLGARNVRYTGRRRFNASRSRRRFKKRLHRSRSRHSRKKRSAVTFAKVVQALEPWQTFIAEYGQEHTVPGVIAASSTRPCYYFCVERYSAADTRNIVTTIELLDYRHLATIFNYLWRNTLTNSFLGVSGNSTAVATAAKNRALIRGTQTSTIRNQSTEPVVIRAWILKPRHHIPAPRLGAGGSVNFYNYLSLGFANNSLDSANALPSNNLTMQDSNFTPFNSFDVCRHWNIRALKPRTVDPGRMTQYKLSVRTRAHRALDYFYTAGAGSGASFASGTEQIYDFIKPSRTMLFRIDASPAGLGAAPVNYTALIQETTPTVIMDTVFKYQAKWLWNPYQPSGVIEKTGIVDTATAAHNPAIIVEGGDVVGEEKDGL